jgi:hypothetical protein
MCGLTLILIDSAQVMGGLPFSYLNGDFLDSLQGVQYYSDRNLGSFTGIQTSLQKGDLYHTDIAGETGAHVLNRTGLNESGLLSAIMDVAFQVLPNELGLITIADIRGAEMIRSFAANGGDIKIFAHSQGTMTFYKALDLVDNRDIRSRISYVGAGSQKFIGDNLGLGSVDNIWNRNGNGNFDKVPLANYVPTMAHPGGIFQQPSFRTIDSYLNGTQSPYGGSIDHGFYYYAPYIRSSLGL